MLGLFFRQIPETLPEWAVSLLNYFDLTDFAALQERFSAVLTAGRASSSRLRRSRSGRTRSA